MKSNRLVPLVVLALLGGCDTQYYPKPREGDVDKQSIRGVYQRTGYGQLLKLDDEKYRLYQYNSRYCIAVDEGARNKFLDLIDHVKQQKNGSQLTFKMSNAAAFSVVTEKLDKLPQNCTKPLSPTFDPVVNFEYFWHTLNDHYAFFAERGIDWAERYREFSPRVTANTGQKELFDIMADMISGFNDGHLWLYSDIAGRPYSAGGWKLTRWEQLHANLAAEQGIDDTDAVLQTLLDSQINLMQNYAGGQLHQALPGQPLYWGLSPDNIGYVFLTGMSGYADAEESSDHFEAMSADEAAAEKAFTQMMEELTTAHAIIIDNRFNPGGHDSIAQSLANHFVSSDTQVLDKFVRNRLATTDKQALHLKPTQPLFTKPVYLLNSENTGSAAETFSLMLKDLPQVTIIGEATYGSLSDVLPFQLPNGWQMGLSNEIYRDSMGDEFEGKGIAADQSAPIFSAQDIALQRQTLYDRALKDMGRPNVPKTTTADLEAMINNALDQGVVPGLAIALVKEGKPIFTKAFGKASESEPVTAATPFTLASASAILGGTLAALLVEHGKLQENAELDIQVGFDISQPAHYHPIRFSHLLSHTSGILDGPQYACSFYILANNTSLWDLFDHHPNCPEPVAATLDVFLPSYLQRTGQYYDAANFNQSADFQPGSHFEYSNTATALAAHWMAKTQGVPYATLSERDLLEPLGMSQSAWLLGDKVSADALADRYKWAPESNRLEPLADYSNGAWPASDFKASLDDLVLFAQAMLRPNHPVVTDNLKQRIFKPLWDQPSAYGWNGVGYNWLLDGDYAYHTGSDPGSSSFLLLNRQQQTAMVVLINTDADTPGFDDFFAELKRMGWHYLLGY